MQPQQSCVGVHARAMGHKGPEQRVPPKYDRGGCSEIVQPVSTAAGLS